MPGFDSPEGRASSAEAAKAVEKASQAAKAAALAELASALGREQRYEESLQRGLEALDLTEASKDQKGKACCFFILARTHILRGADAAGQHYCAKALTIFKELKLSAWEEAAARLLLSSIGLNESEVQRARRAARGAMDAIQVAVERRRQSLLRLNEAKVFMNRGDHEAALNCACDAFSLAEGEPEDLGGPPPMRPANLCLSNEVCRAMVSAADLLSSKEKVALSYKAKALALQGDVVAAKAAAKEAVEAVRQQKDAVGEVTALTTLAAIQASPELGETPEAVQAADQAVQASKNLPKSAQISAICCLSQIQGSQSQALDLAGADQLLQVEALCSLAQVQLRAESCTEALASSEKVLRIFAAVPDAAGQVVANCMVALCSGMLGQASTARSAATDACTLAQTADDMGNEAAAQMAQIFAALSGSSGASALEAAKRLLKFTRHFEDPVSESWALLELSRLQMAEDPGQGVRSAEEALAAAAKANAPRAVAAATVVLARAHAARQKIVAARRVVERLQELPGRGASTLALGRRGEALAQLLTAKVLRGAAQAVPAAKDAQVLMSGLKDKVGEGAAYLAVAESLAGQQSYEQALAAAKQSSACFKAGRCGVGEGVALCAAAAIQLSMEDALEAEKTAQEALRIFQQIRSLSVLKRCSALAGEARARQLLAHTQLSSLSPSSARLFFDEFNCAHLELTEMASQESLEAAVATLHNMQRTRNNVKAVVMHLDGVVGPANMHSYFLTSGNFLVGLRSISIPIILAAAGKITGPSWQLVLGCDYRICSVDTDFLLPILSPPECLQELVGAALASQLCISSGVLDAQGLQELGILNQVRPSKEETARAASELAKRIAGFPGIACRQTMSLLTVPPVRYTTVGTYKLPDPDLIA